MGAWAGKRPELDSAEDNGEQRTKMILRRSRPLSSERSRAYVTSTEFCTVFAENINSLHLLSLLLTADLTKAEETVLFLAWKIASREATCFETGHDPGRGGRLSRMQFVC
jgi:hypothetical protein